MFHLSATITQKLPQVALKEPVPIITFDGLNDDNGGFDTHKAARSEFALTQVGDRDWGPGSGKHPRVRGCS